MSLDPVLCEIVICFHTSYCILVLYWCTTFNNCQEHCSVQILLWMQLARNSASGIPYPSAQPVIGSQSPLVAQSCLVDIVRLSYCYTTFPIKDCPDNFVEYRSVQILLWIEGAHCIIHQNYWQPDRAGDWRCSTSCFDPLSCNGSSAFEASCSSLTTESQAMASLFSNYVCEVLTQSIDSIALWTLIIWRKYTCTNKTIRSRKEFTRRTNNGSQSALTISSTNWSFLACLLLMILALQVGHSEPNVVGCFPR